MKNAIIIHGMPSKEEFFSPAGSQHNMHWLPWLRKQLGKHHVEAEVPEFPEPYDPDYAEWRKVLETFRVGEETVLVGHSCGAGFLVRWLSEHKDIKVGKVALVAPYIDKDGNRAQKMFSGLRIDRDLAARTRGIAMFISLDDDGEIIETGAELRRLVRGLELFEWNDRGHFTLEDMDSQEFPELRDWLLA